MATVEKQSFLEMEIAKNERRLKRIEQNPDPSKLKSNKLLYDLELRHRKAQLDALQTGKPFAVGAGPMWDLVRSMGFTPLDAINSADRAGDSAMEHLASLRGMGFPDTACDRTIVCLPMLANGFLPKPNFVFVFNAACDPIKLSFMSMARMFNVPAVYIDAPLEISEDGLAYITAQLREAIEYAESTVPGIKFSEDKLCEIQELERQAFAYYHDIFELKKLIPCPIAGNDAFKEMRLPSVFSDLQLALEWYQLYRDELTERANQGYAAVPNERLRLMWAVSGPFYHDVFPFLAERGVAVPYFQYGMAARYWGFRYGTYGDEKEFGRKLTPLEELARMLQRNSWGGVGSRWIRDSLDIAQYLHMDGIVNFVQIGCTAVTGLKKVLADQAQEEQGIPVLSLEGRMLDRTSFDQERFESDLEQFIDRCWEAKVQRLGTRQA